MWCRVFFSFITFRFTFLKFTFLKFKIVICLIKQCCIIVHAWLFMNSLQKQKDREKYRQQKIKKSLDLSSAVPPLTVTTEKVSGKIF